MKTVQLQPNVRAEPAIAIGMWIGLFIGEALFAIQYWTARIIHRPLLAIGSFALGASASFAVLSATHGCSQARFATLDLKALNNGVELYRADTGAMPARLEDLVPKYARDLHRDPWGNNYVFYRGAGGVAIVSAGPDGQLGTADDIVTITPK